MYASSYTTIDAIDALIARSRSSGRFVASCTHVSRILPPASTPPLLRLRATIRDGIRSGDEHESRGCQKCRFEHDSLSLSLWASTLSTHAIRDDRTIEPAIELGPCSSRFEVSIPTSACFRADSSNLATPPPLRTCRRDSLAFVQMTTTSSLVQGVVQEALGHHWSTGSFSFLFLLSLSLSTPGGWFPTTTRWSTTLTAALATLSYLRSCIVLYRGAECVHPPGGGKLPKSVVLLTRGKETSAGRGAGRRRGRETREYERGRKVIFTLHYLARWARTTRS